MPLSTYAKSAALDAALPTTIWASLHSGTPPTLVNELTGGGYVRKQLSLPSAFGLASRKATGAPPICTFDVPSSSITCVGIWDASSNGNLLAWFDSDDVAVTQNDAVDIYSLEFDVGDLGA